MFGGNGNNDSQINPDDETFWGTEAGGSGYLNGDYDMNGQCNPLAPLAT